MASFKEAINKVFGEEGGYVNNKKDRGGATNMGITLKTFKQVNPNGIVEDLKNLSRMEAEQIYFDLYWNPNKYDLINSQRIATKVFDTHVNTGLIANKFLQRAYNSLKLDTLVDDGIIGSKTIKFINDAVQKGYELQLLQEYSKLQIKFYENLVENRPDQEVFLDGWINRAKRY